MADFKPGIGDIEEARDQIEKGLNKVQEFLPKDKEIKVGLGWTESSFTKEKMNGVSGMAHSGSYIEIDFNSNVDSWKDSVLGTAVHEATHSFFYEKIGFNHEQDQLQIWQYILDEALTQNMTERLAPEASEPWRTEHSKEEIAEHWEKIKEEELNRNYQYPDPLYINKEEGGYPNWLGYSLSYLIGKELLKEYRPEDFPNLGKEDVIEAGDKLFNAK